MGCWEIGILNFPKVEPGFNTYDGVQSKAIKGMVDRILSDKDSDKYNYVDKNILERPKFV